MTTMLAPQISKPFGGSVPYSAGTFLPKPEVDVNLSEEVRNIEIDYSEYLEKGKIYYKPLPEGAIAPNLVYSFKDSLEIGESLNFAVAFKNVSPHPFDSVSVKMNITDKNNVAQTIVIPKQKPIVSGDTIALRMTIDSKKFADANTMFLEFNPNNDQPEQYETEKKLAKVK